MLGSTQRSKGRRFQRVRGSLSEEKPAGYMHDACCE
jgi:hypothetical protein